MELPDRLLRAATEVDHENHEALVALPPLSPEIVGECRFVRLSDRPDTAVLGVTVADAWQRRGLGSALLARVSARALELGITYFTAEVLAKNRTMLAILPMLGDVETERSGAIVDAQIEIAGPDLDDQAGLLKFMGALAPRLTVLSGPARVGAQRPAGQRPAAPPQRDSSARQGAKQAWLPHSCSGECGSHRLTDRAHRPRKPPDGGGILAPLTTATC